MVKTIYVAQSASGTIYGAFKTREKAMKKIKWLQAQNRKRGMNNWRAYWPEKVELWE
jgi:hypothetical protein